MRLLFALCLLCCLCLPILAYLPAMYMHGVTGSSHDADTMAMYIRKYHPGTIFVQLQIEEKDDSLLHSLDYQLEKVRAGIEQAKRDYNIDKFHLVCHSQGAILCRGYLSTQPNHTVVNFVSLAGPHMGQFGDTQVVERYIPWLKNISREELYKVFYTPILQEHCSIANFWRDPYHYPEFLTISNYIGKINGEASCSYTSQLAKNFNRLSKAIFYGGSDDEVIEPPLSSVFSFWKPTTQKDTYIMLGMKEQEVYLKDTFGLKTMDSRNAVVTMVLANTLHMDWVDKEDIFVKYIAPYLT